MSVPLRKKFLGGMGGMADNLMMNAVTQLALPIYNIGFGLNSGMCGPGVSDYLGSKYQTFATGFRTVGSGSPRFCDGSLFRSRNY
jgi:hypothetical protein